MEERTKNNYLKYSLLIVICLIIIGFGSTYVYLKIQNKDDNLEKNGETNKENTDDLNDKTEENKNDTSDELDNDKKPNTNDETNEKYNSNITLYNRILLDNQKVVKRSDFSTTNEANTTGTIYSTNFTEDGSTVYYYSGNHENNWVKFGGFYWRIIRTNEDGSVRLLYSGTSPDTTAGYINESNYTFNSLFNNPLYVGYMYGSSDSLESNRTNDTSSTIKTYVDTWYKNNLLDNYDKYISRTAIYCNDRSVGNGTYNTGNTAFDYGAYTRLKTNKTPTYKCGGNTTGGLFESTQAISDKFSASTTGGGNGQLQYPIALMTADEIVFAGGEGSWYYKNRFGNSITGGTSWWTMSPAGWSNSFSGGFFADTSHSNGKLSTHFVHFSAGVRPVISLKSCVVVSMGDGSSSNPYMIDLPSDDSCNNINN